MSIGNIVGGALSIGSALIGSSAAGKAARAQQEAAQRGVTAIDSATQQGQEWQAPWRTAGTEAIGRLSDMSKPGYDYTMSPDYQFQFGEGRRAVEGSAASKGLLMSGGNLKDLTRFGTGLAMQGIGDTFNRTATVANMGQQAATTSGQLGMQGAQSIADLYTQGGNAKASGYAGQAGAWGGALSNLSSLANSKGVGKVLGSIF